MNREFDPVIVLLPVAVVTYLFLGAYVEALILIGLFVPEMVVRKLNEKLKLKQETTKQ